ncbi:uncharacterized protein AMSG_01269 [Thecamonas trahens ATCC 50062]|uniref:Uncharacterized protein n=1 Tax=Thecamonas trahens ATCC 50062 TaxID=461836 RepID=A0A0L0DQ58_THETB|nr:hypothetical protein AMSG_01269 [Thecamonas trahens ATCC 50062]KNC53558.1 hypothetical protein AMSG_01269 [Thecamonas trahens ATCC 50062]|eukprot:XP_013761877.1 hypothetical protein AMSG_01269 [Thecamonas trahens ATCC 50062]
MPQTGRRPTDKRRAALLAWRKTSTPGPGAYRNAAPSTLKPSSTGVSIPRSALSSHAAFDWAKFG